MPNAIDLDNLALAQVGDQDAFGRLTTPYCRELLAHCYRMLGSLQDAEDLVQETLLRAWRRLDSFERQVSFRAWLYRIATNACLDLLDKRRVRTLPAAAHPPSDPQELFAPPTAEINWLEPIPDDLLDDAATSPEARYSVHESITLAFLIVLQTLPPRQRAVVIMRDVLDFSANEVAEILEMTVAAVNSGLHRGRVTLAKHYHANGEARLQPADESLFKLLEQYILAWETGDVGKLVSLLKDDAILAMPPSPSWYFGNTAIRTFLENFPFWGQSRGLWHLEPMSANAQPAFKLFRRDSVTDPFQAIGIQVLTLYERQIAEITVFLNPEFFVRFGFNR